LPRFLLDENVPISLRGTLEARGFQASLVVEMLGAGARNHSVAELGRQSGDIILTFDEDFLRLKFDPSRMVKVIYIKIHPRDPRVAQRLVETWIEKCVKLLEKADVVRLTETGPVAERSTTVQSG
jgi:predicted nuclease of predicted toxin-antitoxin system